MIGALETSSFSSNTDISVLPKLIKTKLTICTCVGFIALESELIYYSAKVPTGRRAITIKLLHP
jgi:hypothetical protein